MRWLKIAGIGLGALLLLVLALAAFALGTTPGARIVLTRVVSAEVTIDRVDGRLWGPLILEGVRYETPGMSARVAGVRVDWKPLRLLFDRTVEVTALEVDTARVELRPTGREPAADDGGPIRPSVPVAVLLERLEARQLRVRTAAGDTVRAGLVALTARARRDTFDLDTLRLRDFDLRGHRFRLDAGGRLVTGAVSERDTAGIDLVWSGRLADGRPVAGEGAVYGAAGSLRLRHRLSEPVVARTDATVRDPWLPEQLRWEMTTEVPRVALDRLRDDLPGEAELELHASGGVAAVRARLAARGAHPAVGPVAVALEGAYRGDTLTVDTLRVRRLDAPGAVRGGGRVVLGEGGPSVDVDVGWRDLAWPLDSAAIASPDGTLRVTGRLADFRAQGALALQQPGRPLGRWTVDVSGGYEGDRLRLPDLVARSAGGARLSATADVTLDSVPDGRATVQWSSLAWPPAGDSVRVASADGRIEVAGSVDDFTVSGDASVSGPAVPLSITRLRLDVRGGGPDPLRARIRGTGLAGERPVLELLARGEYRPADRFLAVDTLDARLPETGGRLAVRGQAELTDVLRTAEARVRWTGLAFPLDSARFRSEEGRLDVRSRAGRVAVSGEFRLGGESLPEGRWRVDGAGDRDRFVVDSIRGLLLDGRVVATGVVRPDSAAWELEVSGDSLAPQQWREGWPGRVGFRLRTDGALSDAGPRYRVTLDTLDGTLRDRPVAARARLEGLGGRLRIDTLRLRSAGSFVAAAGTLDDTLALDWRLEAEDLGDFVPDVTGRLQASGTLAGDRARPSLTLEAEGTELAAAGWSVGRLTADGRVADGGRSPSSLDLLMRDVRGVSVALDSLTVRGDGTRDEHSVTLGAGAPEDVLEARVQGGLDDGLWAGRLERLRLRSRAVGDWRLREPVAIRVGPDSGSVERGCWVGSGQLCVAGSWDEGGVRWDADGERLPLGLLGPVLPQTVAARGEFALVTHGHSAPGVVPTGTFRLTGEAGEVDFEPDVGQVVTRPYERFVIDASSDSTGVEATAEIRLGEPGYLTAEATLPGAAPLADRSVTARLDLHLEDEGAIAGYVPAITGSRGTADAELTVTGRVREPDVEGHVTLAGVGATVTAAGIELSDGRLEARSVNGEWQLDGGIRSDTSRLTLAGSARPPARDRDWRVALRVGGSEVPVFDTPDLRIVVSPDVSVTAGPDSVTLDGEIRVPRARIAIEELEGTVDVSPDVVIVAAEGEAPDSTVVPAAVRGEVQLVLGDSVTIDALGLTGRLDGRLGIAMLPGRPPVGTGELRIHDGEYRIYRQTFQIDQGRLLYASTPLPNPALDLRVTRSRDEVTVGMDITGRARDPRVQLFSDPSMDDEEVLAYLLVGRPLRRLNREQGGQVQNMARSLGVAGGNLLLARLSSVFGLETARIERTAPDEAGQRQTSVVLGRQILPGVHIDYAIGLGDAANVIRLRYRITDHWILQTESGQETGADLLYTFNTTPAALPGPGTSQPQPTPPGRSRPPAPPGPPQDPSS